MSLYHKYRPTTLSEMVGNKETVEIIEQSINKKDTPHVWLFHGPTGCGKTTLARIVASELGCDGTDFREIDSADFRGIDTIREIRKQAQYRPILGERKAFLLDECHQLSRDAQNALLKALEDTQEHVFYFLCTTDPQRLIDTIRGRCLSFPVELLSELEMKRVLRNVVKAEDDTLDKDIYDQIILDAQGHPRNALQILEQVLAVSDEKRAEVAKRAAEQKSETIALCRALLEASSWKKIRSILDGLRTEDPEGIRRAVLGYCTSVLMGGENDRAAVVIEEFSQPFYDTGFAGLVFAAYSVVKEDIPF